VALWLDSIDMVIPYRKDKTKMVQKISQNWTPEERIEVIGAIARQVRRFSTSAANEALLATFQRVHVVAEFDPEYLEDNRDFALMGLEDEFE
jgi:hypothetical protein